MSISYECVASLISTIEQVWSILKSSEAQIFIFVIVCIRTLIGHLTRSEVPEAKELAAVLIASLILCSLVVLTESAAVSRMSSKVDRCIHDESVAVSAIRRP